MLFKVMMPFIWILCKSRMFKNERCCKLRYVQNKAADNSKREDFEDPTLFFVRSGQKCVSLIKIN